VTPPCSRSDPVHEETTARLAGRLSAVLYLLCGALLLVLVPLLPTPPGASRRALVVVACVAVAMGAVIWILPWDRWPRKASLALVPPTFALITVHNYFAAAEGYRYAPFFFITFAWLGLCHRRGTSAAFAPLAAAAYLLPLWAADHWSALTVSSVVYVLPSCVLLGEATALVADRLVQTQQSLREGEASFRKLFSDNPQPMWLFDVAELRFLQVNTAAIAHYGYTEAEFLSMCLTDVERPDDVVARVEAATVDGRTVEHRVSSRHRLSDGRMIDVETTAHHLTFAGQNAVLVAIQDVTERNRFEEQLRHRAFHDPLTELANRSLFADRVEHALARRDRAEGAIAVVMLDLDGFKTINDSLGHSAGDTLLVAMAGRLQENLRASDTAARFGGDEFAILFEDATGSNDVVRRAERLLTALREPFRIGEKTLAVTASIGVAINHTGDGPEELVRNADMAMYMAKGAGKACVRVFETTMHESALHRLELEAEMRRALKAGQFVVHYQPIFRVDTGAVTGFEALVRWQHPQRGLLMPSDFIYIAEETGLVVELGRWVLTEACRHARRWRQHHPTLGLQIGVNLSAVQVRDDRLVDDVAAILAASRLDGTSLILEVTESILVDDSAAAIACLHRLKTLGVHIAMDDFGTGYSSLSYLRTLPIDVLKIDKAFIDAVATDVESAGLVEAIIRMAETLGLETVAEGVENAQQAARLQALGARAVQGYYYSRPLPSSRVVPFLAAHAVSHGDFSVGPHATLS
jgi:diguanylate cyclase (GGDEF)-like protein/PAS domain S-box-containing protein